MNQATRVIKLSTLDEIDQIQRCLSAVSDLMNPELDLHAVNRENLALLLGYFSDRLALVAEGS